MGQADYVAIAVLAVATVPYLIYAAPSWGFREWVGVLVIVPPAVVLG
jgi:hypothetical protein